MEYNPIYKSVTTACQLWWKQSKVWEKNTLLALKTNRNLCSYLVRSRLPPTNDGNIPEPTNMVLDVHTPEIGPPTTPQSYSCFLHKILRRFPTATSQVTHRTYTVCGQLSCSDTNVIYLITCNKRNAQYVGYTRQSLRYQIAQQLNRLSYKDTLPHYMITTETHNIRCVFYRWWTRPQHDAVNNYYYIWINRMKCRYPCGFKIDQMAELSWGVVITKAIPSGIPVSGPGWIQIWMRAGGFGHYTIIYHAVSIDNSWQTHMIMILNTV